MQIDWASNPNIRPACLPDAAAGDYDQWMSTVTGQDDDDYNADHYDDHVNTAYDCEDAADDETSTGRRMSNKRDFHFKLVGWGTTSSGGSVSNVLLEVDVKVEFFFHHIL